MPRILLLLLYLFSVLQSHAQQDSGVWAGEGMYEQGQTITSLLRGLGGEKRLVLKVSNTGAVNGKMEVTYDRSIATLAGDAQDVDFLLAGRYDSAAGSLLLVVTHLRPGRSTSPFTVLRSPDSVYYNIRLQRQQEKQEMIATLDPKRNGNTTTEWVGSSRQATMGLTVSARLTMHLLPMNLRIERFVPDETTRVLSPVPAAAPPLEKRKTEIQHTIRLDTTLVKIDLYDNGEIDGDTATVLLDGRVIIRSRALSTKAVSLTLELPRDQPEHLLELYADNLGSIPPNTALLVLTCKGKRYEITLSSNGTANGSVKLVFAGRP